MNEVESIDTAIEQVERLYRSVTGRDAPPVGEEPFATIPPEKVPEEHVQEQVDRLVQTLTEFSGRTALEVEWKPSISVWDGRNELLITVDLPGVPRDAVHVAVNRGLLQIYGNRQIVSKRDGDQLDLKYAEHPFGKFRRTIPLPLAARVEQLEAHMREGVLEIRVPREVGVSDARTIQVA